MPGWIDKRVEILKTMHADDASFSVIGAALGITRSAAIGKAHRLGLSRPDASPARVTRVRAAERERLPRGGGNMADRVARQRRIAELVAAKPEKITAPIAFDPAHRRELIDLENCHCRYPLWSDGTPFAEKFFCGSPEANLHKGIPYCRGHSVVAFNGYSRGRSAPAAAPHIVLEAAE